LNYLSYLCHIKNKKIGAIEKGNKEHCGRKGVEMGSQPGKEHCFLYPTFAACSHHVFKISIIPLGV